MAEDTALAAKKHKRKKLFLIAGVIVLIVAAAGAGVALRWWQTQNGEGNETSEPTPTLTESAGELQDLRSDGDEEEFNQKLDETLNDPNISDETRYQVLLQKGHAAFDKEDWAGAIETYKQAEQVNGTFEVAELLAETYRLSGDSANAIEYYRKAIELVPDSNPRADAIKETLQDQIDQLEEQQ